MNAKYLASATLISPSFKTDILKKKYLFRHKYRTTENDIFICVIYMSQTLEGRVSFKIFLK